MVSEDDLLCWAVATLALLPLLLLDEAEAEKEPVDE